MVFEPWVFSTVVSGPWGCHKVGLRISQRLFYGLVVVDGIQATYTSIPE